ncbi:MAG: M50 family metallopeptidase [Patescibacteria group bacterium]
MIFIVAWYLWKSLLMYPLRLLVTLLHESGHALAAVLTGGATEFISVDIRGNGRAVTKGGIRLVILNGGYLGSVILGVFVYLLPYGRFGRYALMILAALLLLIAILWIRDFFTMIFSLGLGLGLVLINLSVSNSSAMLVAKFIGSCCILYSVLNIDFHFRYGRMFFNRQTDDQELAKLTKIPARLWQLVWLIISLVIFLLLTKSTLME